ncbi:hypothetical protein N9101_02585 [Akkermansiaceae bacterium]|nr:hypothetical protein [Akkermansiaceae bacterium]
MKLPASTLMMLYLFSLSAFSNPLIEAHQGLAGAQKQLESRLEEVQERFKHNPEFLLFLKKRQESWNHFLSSHAVDPNNVYSAKNHAAHIRDRSKWLNGILINPASIKNPEGLYWDTLGNSLRIKTIGTKIYFGIHKYEYTHGHQGVIGGTIDNWKDGDGLFEANMSRDENRPHTVTIKFELRNGLLIIKPSSSLSFIGGHRAHFDGVYSRISPLKKRDLRILKSDLEFHSPPEFSSPF